MTFGASGVELFVVWSKAFVEARNEPWRARPGAARQKSLRIFDVPALEAMTRTPPIVPFLLLGPVILACVVHLLRGTQAPAWTWLLAFLLGALFWTFVEYVMHRAFFHLEYRGDVGKVFGLFVHGHHHLVPNDPYRLVATPWQIGLLLLLVGGPACALLPWPSFLAGLAGFCSAYLAYEALHYRAHHGRPKSRLGRALQRHHLKHHAGPGNARWGISSPLWDWVFRTLEPSDP